MGLRILRCFLTVVREETTTRAAEEVTADQISFTLAFKKAFWQLSVEGCTGNAAFRKLGYDPDILGFEHVHNITKRIRRAVWTPEGIRGKAKTRMRISREKFSNADLEKMFRRESEQRLQNEIIPREITYSCTRKLRRKFCSPLTIIHTTSVLLSGEIAILLCTCVIKEKFPPTPNFYYPF